MSMSLIVPAIERESVNGIQEISLLTNAFTNRKIFLFGEISAETVSAFTMQMITLMEDEQCEDNQLPVPVRLFMDDFATNCRIDNFENMISNIRSRKIAVTLVLQSLSQLEKGYGQGAHTIADDCDTLIYMGGNDHETAHSIAVRCNKTTQTILQMPLCTSWIFRRGEKPFTCRNMELDDYLKVKLIKQVVGGEKLDQNMERAG